MAVVISTSLAAILFVFLGKYEKRINCLKIAFIIVTFVACIHYNYGNDYRAYYYTWNIIRTNSLKTLFLSTSLDYMNYDKPEIGWVLLNKAFGFNNGFYCMVAVINILEGVIYYKFIRRFVPQKLYFWSFFLYVFTNEYYLLNFSMMRQGFAMTLVLLSFMYFCNKNYKVTFIILAIAVAMHVSAIVVLPFFVICKFEEKINLQIFSLIIIFITVLLFFSSVFSNEIFDFWVSLSMFSKYKLYYAGNVSTDTIGLGFLLMTMPYIVMIFYMTKNSKEISTEEKFLIIFAYIAFLTKPFESVGAALALRVAFYFSVFDIAIVPIMYDRIRNPILRIMLYISLTVLTIYTYITFFLNPVYKEPFAEFHSIFELF